MLETSHESTQPADLSALTASVPRSVVEILGAEQVAAIERLENQAKGLLELSRLPDPFKVTPGITQSLITPEVAHALAEINRIDEIEDLSSEEVSEVARLHAPTLKTSSLEHRKLIANKYNSALDWFKLMPGKLDIDPADTEVVIHELPVQYDLLSEIAADLPAQNIAADLHQVINTENKAFRLDASSVGMRKDSKLFADHQRTWAESLAARFKKQHEKADDLISVHVKIETAARHKGQKSWRVRRAHRTVPSLWSDMQFAERAPELLTKARDRGSRIHARVSEIAADAVMAPSIQMIKAVIASKSEFNERFLGNESAQPAAYDEQTRNAALEAEAYINQKAAVAESLMRTGGLKFTAELRRSMHWLKESEFKQRAKTLGSVVVGEQNPFASLEADAEFRRLCRDARDILVGGGRINHPDAKQLAEELHKLRFGRNRNISLDPSESGLLVGLATDRWDSLMTVIAQMEAHSACADAQVEKLRLELPDQYKILKGFDIDLSLNNLMLLINSIDDRQAIISTFRDRRAGQEALKVISRLWHQRNGIEMPEVPQEEEPEEQFEPEPEPELDEPQPEPTEEEQAIIDAVMVEIADQLEWVVFPSGVKIQDIQRRFSGDNVDLARVNWERIEHLLYLADNFDGRIYRSREPKLGTSVPYLVAEFNVHQRTFAVAECPEIGNATYVVDNSLSAGTWEELMRLSKADARSLGARRIIHPKEDGHLNKILKTVNSLLLIRTS